MTKNSIKNSINWIMNGGELKYPWFSCRIWAWVIIKLDSDGKMSLLIQMGIKINRY